VDGFGKRRRIGDSDVGDIVMLVAKKYFGDIFLHVRGILFGHQHHNTPECDVGD